MKLIRCSKCKSLYLLPNREITIRCAGCGRSIHKDWNPRKQHTVLTFEQRLQLLNDWITLPDTQGIAKKYDVSPNTVRSIVKRSNNPQALEILSDHRL